MAVGLAAAVNIAQPWEDDVPATQLGRAGVAPGDDTARIVERVSYRQDVERIGDVIIVDGRPRDELVGDLAAVWEIVDGIWPGYLRDELAQLSVVREEPRGLVGVVHPSATGGWILSLDVADLPDRALVEETIVHELSHVVTLDREVFTFGEVDDCSGAAIELGCAEAGTILAAYADRFWPDGVAEETGDGVAEETRDGVAGETDVAFVNDYASTSAHEDLSETFTAWVLGWPVEGPTIEAKIAMLAADPELAALAESLRAELLARSGDDPT